MTTLEAIKNWLRVDDELRDPRSRAELRKAMGVSNEEFAPAYKQARIEIDKEKQTRAIMARGLAMPSPDVRPIPRSFSQMDEPEDPLLGYETDGVFDPQKYLAHEGERSAAIGMVKALERGDASALRLQAQLTGKLDAPQVVVDELSADSAASLMFAALKELKEGGFRVNPEMLELLRDTVDKDSDAGRLTSQALDSIKDEDTGRMAEMQI